MPVPFDTYGFITALEESGMPRAQAVTLSTHLQSTFTDGVVTKESFDHAMQRLEERFRFTYWMLSLTFTVLLAIGLGNLWFTFNLLARLPKP